MNFDAVFHALVSILHQHQHGPASRLRADPHDIVLDKDVSNGARFKQWLTHNGDDEVFAFLQKRKLLTEVTDEPAYKAINYTLWLDRPTLREHLASTPTLNVSDEAWLVGTFIDYAQRLGRGEVIGSVVLAGLHIRKGRFAVPAYFNEAMQTLTAAGYCEYTNGSAKWLPKVAPIMQAKGLWIGNQTVDDAQTERLAQIWRTMPEKLKQLALVDRAYPDAYALACFMGEFWHDDSGWSYDGGDLIPDVFDLKGGHLPDAFEISEMVENGSLR